jgi:hypothetical protein
MQLSYLRDDCHKQAVTYIRESRWFKSMYTLQGKAQPTHHMLSALSPCMVQDHTYLTWCTYSDLSRSRQQSWAWPLLLRKRALDTIHSTLTDWSTGPYPISFSSQPMKQWGQSQASVDSSYSAYWAHNRKLAIDTFNTCSQAPTHQSLTDTVGGYNLGGADSPHTTTWPSQPAISTFYLRARPVSSLTKFYRLNQSVEFKEPMVATWSSNHSAIYHSLHLCLAIANDLSLAIGVTRIDRKLS